MYNIPNFKEKDYSVVVDFMKSHPFAMLIGCSSSTPVATQVPLLLEEKGSNIILQGHIMRATDHHKAFTDNSNVLCVFTGADTYVSASLYTNPQTASTWNYMSVQVRGELYFLEEESLIEILEKTTTHFENNPASPASFKNLTKDYIEKLTKAIIGFRIEVHDIQNVFKLSQNKRAEDYANIIEHLSAGDGDAQHIADQMKIRTAQLFQNKP